MLFTRPWQFLTAFASAMLLLVSGLQAAPITSGAGPGGVGMTTTGNLSIWLDADTIAQADNTAVSLWPNARVGGVNGTQGTGSLQPTVQLGELNSRAVVRFDGAGDYVSTAFTMGGTAEASSFVITRQTNSTHGLPFITATAPYFGIHSNNDGVNQTYSTYGPGNTGATRINGVTSSNLPLGNYGILSGLHSGYVGAQQTANYTLPIGSDLCCGGRNLNGDVAEMVVYDTRLNTAQQVIVENYLSAKYAITLNTGGGATDVYAGDGNAEGDYDRDVFGVGRVNALNIHNDADGGGPDSGTGAAGLGIEANLLTLGDGEWILAGHNVATNSLVGDDSLIRWDRVWYVDVTKTDGLEATLSFDFSDAGLPPASNVKLLYADDSGLNFDELAVTPTIVGDTYSFVVPDALLVDGYFTLGVAIPEPASGLLLGLGAIGLMLGVRRRTHRTVEA